MNAEELVGVTVWVDEQIIGRYIPQLYAELESLIRATANGSPQAFGDQKDRLIAELQDVDLTLLSDGQRAFIEKLSLLKHVGDEGVVELKNILYRNSLDVSTASARIAEISAEIQEGVERSNRIKASLSGLIEIYEDPSDEVLMRVSFRGGTSIDDIVDFKKWAGIWYDIGRGVAMAVGDTPEDLRVVGAQKGSIIVVLATTYGIAKVVTFILLKALEVAEKSLSLRKNLLEIEALKLSNNVLEDQIRATASEERKLGLQGISEELKNSLPSMDGEKLEALEKSVSKLLDFIEKGGQVDVVLPAAIEDKSEEDADGDAEGDIAKKLRQDVYKIRELEAEMRKIPHLPHE